MAPLFTQTVNRQTLQSAVLKWFVDEEFSFEQETALANSAAGLAIPGLLPVGQVMGKQTANTPSAAVANAGNAGNGTVSAPVGEPGIQVGTYVVEFIAPTVFNLVDPNGKLVAEGHVGAAFATQLGFTITAGGTAFAAGDGFTIGVAANSGKVVPLNPAATDGSAVAMGVVVRNVSVPSSVDAAAILVERQAVVLFDGLVWPVGITTQQQQTAIAQLASQGIIVRFS